MPQAENMARIIDATLRDLGRARWTDITVELQQFTAMKRLLMMPDLRGFSTSDGYGKRINVSTNRKQNARQTELYDQDVATKQGEHLSFAYVNYKWTTSNMSFDEREIDLNQGGGSQLVDILELKRWEMMTGLAEHLEEQFWGATGDDKDIKGIRYWLVKSLTQGFYGGASDYSTNNENGEVGGINPTNKKLWRNYTDQYTTISVTDAVRKLRRAMDKTGWKAPYPHPTYGGDAGGQDYGPHLGNHRPEDMSIFVGSYASIQEFADLATSQNESVGPDLAAYDGMPRIRGRVLEWVPFLDPQQDVEDSAYTGDDDYPIYGVDWRCFGPVKKDGWDFKENDAYNLVGSQHNVVRKDVDAGLNLGCTDRRRCFVLAKSANNN